MTEIALPHTLSDVTATWLAAALSKPGDPVEISDLTLQRIGTGQAGSTYRATPAYTEPNPTLPETVVVKLPAEDVALRAGLSLGYRSEVAFYGKVAPTVKVPIPQCFHHDISDNGADFALLLSDLDPAVQGDQIGGCSDAQAKNVMAAIAGLHGPSWCDPRWLDVPEFIMPKPGDVGAAQMMGAAAEALTDVVLSRLGEHLSPEDHDTLRTSMAAVASWLVAQPRYSLMHGDFRADNLMFHPIRNTVTIVDWQTISVGLPSRDVAYFTASSLQTDVRRATEESLIDHYHAALLGHGVTNYDRETCWRDYRIGMLQPPLISILGCATATPTERGDAMFVHTLKRSCAAIRDLRTLELIEADAQTA
ncbi:phosphotransferase family protein [Mycolicibacterium vinylchloridicum]|uniref:phosphotransferase family protein n=1 Tax=Mycolicibacterium vinylchloridicum TaxID=2736928 RepID=UPI0015C92DA5|nr:aminoglycoside phosphotransferase family protein [Mycolicibacterium vinylchloridicum]